MSDNEWPATAAITSCAIAATIMISSIGGCVVGVKAVDAGLVQTPNGWGKAETQPPTKPEK